MRILMVNDDGIHSERLSLLCRAAAARGHRVTVCAPAHQQSAKSHSMTIVSPLMIREAQVEGAESAWALEGTPGILNKMAVMPPPVMDAQYTLVKNAMAMTGFMA